MVASSAFANVFPGGGAYGRGRSKLTEAAVAAIDAVATDCAAELLARRDLRGAVRGGARRALSVLIRMEREPVRVESTRSWLGLVLCYVCWRGLAWLRG